MRENDFASLITKMRKTHDIEIEKFTSCLAQLMVAGATQPGFWSAEIAPPSNTDDEEWILRQRFRSYAEAESWQNSENRKNVLKDIQSILGENTYQLTEELLRSDNNTEIATAIVTDLKPGMEDAYFQWELKMQATQAAFPGYRGALIQPPVESRPGQWATLLRFKSPEDLEQWFASPQRKTLLKEGESFVKSTAIKQVENSFPGWFPTDAQGNGPPNWKAAQLVVLGLFPIVMLQIKYCNPFYADLNHISPTIGNVINMVVSCSCVTWVTMPLFIKLFGFWMFPEKPTVKTEMLGEFGVLAFLGLEMLLMWHLL